LRILKTCDRAEFNNHRIVLELSEKMAGKLSTKDPLGFSQIFSAPISAHFAVVEFKPLGIAPPFRVRLTPIGD
jgi:hypothetical protein